MQVSSVQYSTHIYIYSTHLVSLPYDDMPGDANKDIVNCLGEFYHLEHSKMCFRKLEEGLTYC